MQESFKSDLKGFPDGPVVKTSPSKAGGASLIPGQRIKIPTASQPKNQNIKQKQYCNKFNKDFKNGLHTYTHTHTHTYTHKPFKKRIVFFFK